MAQEKGSATETSSTLCTARQPAGALSLFLSTTATPPVTSLRRCLADIRFPPRVCVCVRWPHFALHAGFAVPTDEGRLKGEEVGEQQRVVIPFCNLQHFAGRQFAQHQRSE